MPKSTKIALVIPTDPCQIAHHQPSNPPKCLLIITISSRNRIYYSVLQGESDYQLCFSIGALILWQSAKKHQNCVDDTADPYQIEPSNPPNCLLIIMINSRKRVYYSVSQGEFDYQLYFSIRVIVLWQSAKKHQNCVDDDQITNLQPTKLPSNHHQ